MSIKSGKFPEAFEELFERYDSQDRDKKDVAFLIWCENLERCCQEFKETLVAENKALKEEMKNLLDCCEFSHGAIVDAIAEVGLDGMAGEKVIEIIEEQLTKHGIDYVKFKVSTVSDS